MTIGETSGWQEHQSESDWPQSDLEEVGSCPVCHEHRRALLYRDLTDRLFGVAPGKWTLWRCLGCDVGYLDPRPNEASIGRAYSEYYTHDSPKGSVLDPDGGGARRLAMPLVNGRVNQRLGYARSPASRLGGLVLPAFVRRDRELLGSLRFVAARREQRLLDVGCGNGSYLELMRLLGWDGTGVDPDPTAVAAGVKAGLDVRLGTLFDAHFPDDYFTVVTLSHVIEHVHDPVALLAECRRVLAPDGELIVLTPNLDSAVHRRFEPDWLHLDPPRHLVIFTTGSMRRALASAGFGEVHQLPVRLRGASVAPSAALREAADPWRSVRLSHGLRATAAVANLQSLLNPARAEEVSLRAVKAPSEASE